MQKFLSFFAITGLHFLLFFGTRIYRIVSAHLFAIFFRTIAAFVVLLAAFVVLLPNASDVGGLVLSVAGGHHVIYAALSYLGSETWSFANFLHPISFAEDRTTCVLSLGCADGASHIT